MTGDESGAQAAADRGEVGQGILLTGVCDFGWGSLGKLRLILDELPGVPVALAGAPPITAVVNRLLGERHRFVHCEPHEAAVAVVINDPVVADRISDAGVPVIYVDSLPFLWTTPGEVPSRVAFYCAQKFPHGLLPPSSPLRGRRDLRWVDPIVPRPRRRRGGQGAVVNVGGLHSHLAGSAADAYLRLVVLPVAHILSRTSRRVAAVCGNLPAWACEALAEILPAGTVIGPQSPYRFEEILRHADLLITSPGSTTILQAAALGVPTVLLPPQNLSQILNAEIYTESGRGVVHWPESIIERTLVDHLRPRGEDVVLEYIYAAISASAESPTASREIAAALADAIPALEVDLPFSAALPALGTSGASQIARLVRQALLAPLPQPAAPDREIMGQTGH